jgi:cyclase
MMRRVFGAVLPSLLLSSGVAGQNPSWPRVTVDYLRGSLYLLTVHHTEDSHVNMLASVGGDGTLLVDYAGDWRTMTASPELQAVIEHAVDGIGSWPPRYLIDTHWHGDHTAGNLVVGESTIIVAHENTRRLLSERQTPHWYPQGMGPMDRAGWPDTTFTDSLTLYVNADTVRLFNFGPAHSAGDAIVVFEAARVADLGDLYHGLADPSFGEDMVGLARTLTIIARRLPLDAMVVTGHGSVTDVRELRLYQRMLSETLVSVRLQMEAGATLAEIQERGVPVQWSGIIEGRDVEDAWLAEMYRTLGGK